ncbi:MAG: DUF433 domain-containing protein [Pirellulales bacterium]
MSTNAQPVHQKHIELRPNRDGQLRAYIVGTRVRVQDVYVDSDIRGKSPDEIIASLPHLTLAQVHAALAYSFDNRESILNELREDGRSVAEIKSETGPGPLEQKRRGTAGHGDSVPS